jgi:hypothetical protein
MRALLTLLLYTLSSSLWAEVPSRIEASYDVLSKGIRFAVVKEVFVRNDDHYRIESVTKPVGLLALFQPETIVVTSEGEIGDEGLRPYKFTHQRVRDSAKNNSAEFDWTNNELTLRDQSGIRQLPLPPGTQDRLSIMYQFVVMPPHGRLEIKFNMTNGSKLEAYRYQLHPEQTVEVPFGSLKSYYLYTLPQKTSWKSEIWLAVEHSYMPCKMVLTEDSGDKVVQVLTALNIVP